MYHSITLDGKNTWTDFKLMPTSKPAVAPPPVHTRYVEIPGYDGVVDLTEALTGCPTYGQRTGSWTFIMYPTDTEPHTRYSELLEFLHGQEFEAIELEDDPDYIYQGRLSVGSYSPGKNWSTISINYELQPYKREKFTSTDNWEWDSFNFETGVIRDYKSLTVNGTLTIRVVGSVARIVPDIVISAPMSITYNGVTVSYTAAGTYHPIEFSLLEGEHNMTFTGNGIVSVVYRGGLL